MEKTVECDQGSTSESASRRLHESAARAAEWVADLLDRHKYLYLLLFSLLYFAGTTVMAAQRKIWADEVITGYLARIKLSQIIPAITTGTDVHPPLFHVITRLFTTLIGDNPVGLRMSAILGGWLMSISLFVFVSRRGRTLYAAIAMLIPFVTIAKIYTYEARGYGIALGFCGLALICWQAAAEERRSILSCVGLGLSLVVAVCCQYYMVIAIAALGVGEVTRSFQRKRIDAPIWMALIAGALPAPLHLPLIRAAMTFGGPDLSNLGLSRLLGAYQSFLTATIIPAVVVLIGVTLYRGWYGKGNEASRESSGVNLTRAELAAIVTLSLGLAGAVILARLTSGDFFPRYGICAILGLSILPVLLLSWSDRPGVFGGSLAFLVLFTLFTADQLSGDKNRFFMPSMLAKTAGTSVVVIQNPLRHLELAYNAPRDIASNLYYLVSSQDSNHYIGQDDNERGSLALNQWAPIHAVTLQPFLDSHREFLVWRNSDGGWILRYLADHGASIRLLEVMGSEYLFRVTMPDRVASGN